MYLSKRQSRMLEVEFLKRGILKSQIHKHLGGSRQQWSKFLNGKTDMRVSTILKISKLLGFTPQQIGEVFFDYKEVPHIVEVKPKI